MLTVHLGSNRLSVVSLSNGLRCLPPTKLPLNRGVALSKVKKSKSTVLHVDIPEENPPTPADGKGERVRAEMFFEASNSSSSRDKQVASEQPQQWKQRQQLAAR